MRRRPQFRSTVRRASVALVVTILGLAGSAQAEQIAAMGADYAAACQSRGVPLPPPWGGLNSKWIARGSFDNSDSFVLFAADVWYYQQTTSPQGLCVIAAHNNNFFDIICQGTNGKACFWEGKQSRLPPANPVVLADPSAAVAQNFVKGGLAMVLDNTQPCTHCHAGQNAFINHYKGNQAGGGTHPLNLRAFSGWLSSTKYEPIVGPDWRENPGPETFPGYPASTTGCLSGSCHTAATAGGFFPALSVELQGGYCPLLATVTNRPDGEGGMGMINCTSGNCARDTDPFVKAMLDVGCNNPPSAAWGINQLRRFDNLAYEAPALFTRPSTTKFIYPANASFPEDPLRLTPTVYTSVENGTNHNRVLFAVGPLGMASKPSLWLKGSTYTFVQNLWNGTTGGYDIWEYEGTTLRNASAGAMFKTIGLPLGHRRHNAKSMILYRGSNNQMQGLHWVNSAWSWEPFPANPAGAPLDGRERMASDPTSFKRSSTGDSFLYRPFGCNNCISEYRLASGVYYRATLLTATNMRPGTLPRGMRDASGTASIFASTEGGIVWLRATSASDSVFQYSTSTVTTKVASSSPVPFFDHNGRLALAWRESTATGDKMHITTYNGSSWTDTDLPSKVGLSSEGDTVVADPAAYVTSDGRDTIVFRGYSQAVFQYELNGSTWKRSKIFKVATP